MSYKLLLSRFRTKTLRAHLLSPIRATWPASPINLDLMTRKIFNMSSTFPSHGEHDLFLVPVTEKETRRLKLVACDFRLFAGPTKVLSHRLALLPLKAPLTAPQ